MPKKIPQRYCAYCADPMPHRTRKTFCSLECRFWSRVATGDDTDCWELTRGPFTDNGYGLFAFDGTSTTAHKFAFECYVGPVPVGLQLLHSCDNRKCVNYREHLSIGTQQENTDDMCMKGRQARSPWWKHNTTKLTPEKVIEIRRRWAEPARQSLRQLGAEFGVSNTTISAIVNNRNWRGEEFQWQPLQ